MKEVDGYLNIEVNVECPHCEEYLNLLDSDLNEEGYLSGKVLGDRFGCEGFNEEITCPKCKKEFKVTSVWY